MSQESSNPAPEAQVNPVYAEGEAPSNAEQALKAPEAAPPESPYKDADQEFARKFAALSRQEREMREMREAFEADKAAIEAEKARIAELKEQYSSNEELRKQLKYNPLKTLEEAAGYKFDDLTKFAMNGGDVTTETKMEMMRRELEDKFGSELEGIKSQYEETERKKAEAQQAQAEQNFKEEIKDTIASTKTEDGTPKYEFIAANDASDIVFDVVEQHYNETGKILEIEEAAEMVESHLEEEAEKLFKSVSKYSKFSKPEESSKEPVSAGQESPTLSNDLASQSPKQSLRLSKEQSLAEAAKRLRWND